MSGENVLNKFITPEGGDDNEFVMGGTVSQGATGTLDLDGTVKKGGVEVTATSAALNRQDLSAQTETILISGVISPNLKVSYLNTTVGGAAAITLAVPDASMVGQTKVIEMAADGGDVTMALTNVQGGSAGTTATWDAVGEALILIAGLAKWNVASEGGVTLS